jgi:hypothetical protein
MVATVSLTPVSFTSAQTTAAPSLPNRSAVARPMPEPAPVISTVRPWNRFMILLAVRSIVEHVSLFPASLAGLQTVG